jgi:hypothetical protein
MQMKLQFFRHALQLYDNIELHCRQHAFGEESWSLPLNGLTKFPEDVTVGVGIYSLSLRLECSEQYAFVIPVDCEHHFPGGWCHLIFFWQATQDVSTALLQATSIC